MALNLKIFRKIYRKLVETRWLFTFTASCTATIVGITLTFGINSYRENRRVEQEARESIMQAIENLHLRADYIDIVFSDMACQDSLYNEVRELYSANQEIPDSLSKAFLASLLQYRPEVGNTSYEKMFLGSYQLWQELDKDCFTYGLSAAFALANSLEEYCHYHHQQIYIEMQKCTGIGKLFRDHSDIDKKTKALMENDEFCFYMYSRSVSTSAMQERNELNKRLIEALDREYADLIHNDEDTNNNTDD
jgi:hypothetical protein